MLKNPIKLSATLLGMALVAFTSCEDQDFTDVNNDATRVEVNTISAISAEIVFTSTRVEVNTISAEMAEIVFTSTRVASLFTSVKSWSSQEVKATKAIPNKVALNLIGFFNIV